MRHALVTFGNEESYGLLFVGGELKEFGQDMRFFDSEKDEDFIDSLVDYNPHYVMFSPMTTFFPRAYAACQEVKERCPDVVSVFGGHHAIAVPQIAEMEGVDVVVRGPVRGSVEKILEGKQGLITTTPTTPDDLPMPARQEYFRDVPRMRDRYRKFMLSMLGCPFNCTYCSSAVGHTRERFGIEAVRNYFLTRRPLEHVLAEAEEIVSYPTEEIEWVDDDIFTGADVEEWLGAFIDEWKKRIDRPMYISTTSQYALKVSDGLLKKLQPFVSAVGMGIQAIRPESLKLFGRQWDNEEKMKAAYDRLASFGYDVNLQAIIGLPVEDPVEDAMDTIKAMQRIGTGSVVSVYPLEIYPNTKMNTYVREKNFPLNEECVGDTNTGVTGIQFDAQTEKRLRNICKLATPFVRFGVDERWMRAMIDVDFDDETSKNLSLARYHDCVVDRLGERGESVFEKVIGGMNIRY